MANGSGGGPPSKTILVAAAVLAAAVMVIGNTLIQRLDPKVQEQMEKEAAAKAAADAAKKATPAPSASPVAGASASGSAGAAPTDLATLGANAMLGPKESPREITVRWSWTPAVQADPAKVWDSIQTLQKSMPEVRIHAINVDASEIPEEPTGVYDDKKLVVPTNPDGSISTDKLKAVEK